MGGFLDQQVIQMAENVLVCKYFFEQSKPTHEKHIEIHNFCETNIQHQSCVMIIQHV